MDNIEIIEQRKDHEHSEMNAQTNVAQNAPQTPKPIKIKREVKAEVFASEYVRNGQNGLQAYKVVNPHVTDGTAGVQATRLLKRDRVKKAIAERLPSDMRIVRHLNTALETKTPDIMDWSTKHKFIRTMLELKGYLKDKREPNVNIALVVRK